MRLHEDEARELYLRGYISSYLLSWPKMVDHAVNFIDCRSGSLRSKNLEGVDIFGFHGFFSGLHDHTAFHPHLDSFCDWQIRAFGNKHRCKLGVTGAQYFIIKRLLSVCQRILWGDRKIPRGRMLNAAHLPTNRRFLSLCNFFQLSPVTFGN